MVDSTYNIVKLFPSYERFSLSEQFRRAAISIVLNIAEGSGRTKRDFRHFLRNARASCYECVAIIQISHRRAYITDVIKKDGINQLVRIAKMISGLIRSLGG